MSANKKLICKAVIEKGNWTRTLCDLCLVRSKHNCQNLKLIAEKYAEPKAR